MATISLLPYSKKKIDPKKLIPFPWDKEVEKPRVIHNQEADKKRMRDMFNKFGDTF